MRGVQWDVMRPPSSRVADMVSWSRSEVYKQVNSTAYNLKSAFGAYDILHCLFFYRTGLSRWSEAGGWKLYAGVTENQRNEGF